MFFSLCFSNTLSNTSGNRIKLHGEQSTECAEYYFNYGDALMYYLETEDLIDNNNQEDDNTYIAPNKKLSYETNEKAQASNSVIDLEADMIEQPDEAEQFVL